MGINFISWLWDSSSLLAKPHALGSLISQGKAESLIQDNYICLWLAILKEYLKPTSCSGEARLYSSLKGSQPFLSTKQNICWFRNVGITSLRPLPHYAREIWKRSYISTVWRTVHTTKFVTKTELYENDEVRTVMWFFCPSFLQTQIQNDR